MVSASAEESRKEEEEEEAPRFPVTTSAGRSMRGLTSRQSCRWFTPRRFKAALYSPARDRLTRVLARCACVHRSQPAAKLM